MAVCKSSMEFRGGGYASLHVGADAPDLISLAVRNDRLLTQAEAVELATMLLVAVRMGNAYTAENSTP